MPHSVLMPAPVRTTHGRCFSHQLREPLDAHRVNTAPMEGFTFSTDVRVRFAETDAQGIAHNASYLVWFEVARVEYLRAYAGGYQSLRDQGIEALVLESHCRYVEPARFDDLLHVHARCVDVRGARFRFEYAIVRDDGDLIADGWTSHASSTRDAPPDADAGVAHGGYCVG